MIGLDGTVALFASPCEVWVFEVQHAASVAFETPPLSGRRYLMRRAVVFEVSTLISGCRGFVGRAQYQCG